MGWARRIAAALKALGALRMLLVYRGEGFRSNRNQVRMMPLPLTSISPCSSSTNASLRHGGRLATPESCPRRPSIPFATRRSPHRPKTVEEFLRADDAGHHGAAAQLHADRDVASMRILEVSSSLLHVEGELASALSPATTGQPER